MLPYARKRSEQINHPSGEGIMKKVSASVIIASLIFWAGMLAAQTANVTVTVDGKSGPWSWADGGLNTAYQYATQHPDYTAPTVISTTNGFRFSAGDSLTISYVSGFVAWSVHSGTNFDALGDTSVVENQFTDGAYGVGPSYFMNPATYPIYQAELVGTFAGSGGQIVGTPFAIGDLGTFTIPTGATQLQLGVNDNNFIDNAGSWNIQVTQTVPEPTTTALVLMSLVGFGLATRRCRRSAVR
jgi:hypothetical protein